MAPSATHPILHRGARFGPFHVDFLSYELFKNGTKVHLQDHSFKVLSMLLERPGEVISREELGERLWHSHTFVEFDQGLNTAIMRLRHALEDAAETPRFVETLPRHGYRFIAPVTYVDTEVEEPKQSCDASQNHEAAFQDLSQLGCISPESQRAPEHRLRRLGIFALCLLPVVVLLVIYGRGVYATLICWHSPAVDVPTLAVLPFDSLSADADQKFLAESITEQLITELGQTEKLRVLSRGSVMGYADKHLPLENVASELHADAIFEGSITRTSGRIRVTANLYQVATRRHLWAKTYESEAGDGLSPQRDIARDIAQKIQANLIRQ